MIRVRFAEPVDQPRLLDFVRDHWSATHIFVDRPEVFAWQHLDPAGRLNMVMAEQVDEAGTRTVLGVLGFIPMGRFDPALGDRDVMLAIWKVREDGTPPGLGLRLLKFLRAQLAPRMIAAIGTSQIVRPIYEVLGYDVGELHHAALFPAAPARAYRIAQGVPKRAPSAADPAGAHGTTLERLDGSAPDPLRSAIDEIGSGAIPVKSWRYLAERFLEHPWYRYEVRAVRQRGVVAAVVVWRVVDAEGSRALRIVDIIGGTDWLRDARPVLEAEVTAADAEYIDIMQWGIDPAALQDAGFVSPATSPGLIVPNYFSPFERRNVTIEIAVKVFDGARPVHLFRADSDQDRPNVPADVDGRRPV